MNSFGNQFILAETVFQVINLKKDSEDGELGTSPSESDL